ncbi:MAG: hypothetical protein Q9165_008017 [Trypethelium subeluteriae]
MTLGGLVTSISSLKANLFLSSAVACTGVTAPIALSFLLKPLANATSLQAFAAGAALCSTSLGTTFTIMSVSGLTNTGLGIVLGTAAMEDDVIGLVMVQIITGLGRSDASIGTATIVRPIAVSIGFAIALPLICVLLVKPVTRVLTRQPAVGLRARLLRSTKDPLVVLLIHNLILLSLIAGASYAGTSTLFAAYLAGACISWFDETSPGALSNGQALLGGTLNSSANTTATSPDLTTNNDVGVMVEKKLTGINIYEKYYAQPLNKIFKPFFFASIGFSIPITQMFSGPVVWRGVVYSFLMALGKLLCGIWFIGHRAETVTQSDHAESDNRRSLYPAAILGSAMVARGEIGFLVSSLAASNGIFDSSGYSADVFLIVTWAIVLCTILGPVAVGLLMRKMRASPDQIDGSAAREAGWDTFRDWSDSD